MRGEKLFRFLVGGFFLGGAVRYPACVARTRGSLRTINARCETIDAAPFRRRQQICSNITIKLGGKSDALEVSSAPVHSFINGVRGFVYFWRLFAVEFNATDI
jgi:hypothetical protein